MEEVKLGGRSGLGALRFYFEVARRFYLTNANHAAGRITIGTLPFVKTITPLLWGVHFVDQEKVQWDSLFPLGAPNRFPAGDNRRKTLSLSGLPQSDLMGRRHRGFSI